MYSKLAKSRALMHNTAWKECLRLKQKRFKQMGYASENENSPSEQDEYLLENSTEDSEQWSTADSEPVVASDSDSDCESLQSLDTQEAEEFHFKNCNQYSAPILQFVYSARYSEYEDSLILSRIEQNGGKGDEATYTRLARDLGRSKIGIVQRLTTLRKRKYVPSETNKEDQQITYDTQVCAAPQCSAEFPGQLTIPSSTASNAVCQHIAPTLRNTDYVILQRVQEHTDRGCGMLWAPLDRELGWRPGAARQRWAQLLHRDETLLAAARSSEWSDPDAQHVQIWAVMRDMMEALVTVFDRLSRRDTGDSSISTLH